MQHPTHFMILACTLVMVNTIDAQGQLYASLYEYSCSKECKAPLTVVSYPVYFGADPAIETVRIKINRQTQKEGWYQAKRENCVPSNKDNCLIWCLRPEKFKKATLNVVVDTAATKLWKMHHDTVAQRGDYLSYDVICKEDQSAELIQSISEVLERMGYVVPSKNKSRKLKGKLLNALRKFQYDNELPLGELTYLTMEALSTN